MNEVVLRAFGLRDGVSHTEFIRAHEDGALYFLETSARVGGASIADLIETPAGSTCGRNGRGWRRPQRGEVNTR